jgi:Fur family peroxide stress response transcriptional regulator
MQKEMKHSDRELLAAACRDHGLRVTPQRQAIHDLLAGSKEHPSADEVFRQVREHFPHISYDTVNRTLLTFVRIGLIGTVESPGGPRRFDPDIGQHHHFHCRRCGRIVDFHNEDYDRLEIPGYIRNKFTVLDKKVILIGLCDRHGSS